MSPLKIPSIRAFLAVIRKIFGNGRGALNVSSRSTARGERAIIPCAASPPRAFCQDQVTTSNRSHGRSMAKAADVASQMTKPSCWAGITSPAGRRTPEVVPFHASTTSCAQLTSDRSGNWPYSALSTRVSSSFSWVTISCAHRAEKLSNASTSTGRSPSNDHNAISTAPVSDAGTMPTRQPSGTPRIVRDRTITSFSRARPSGERCERPTSALDSAATLHPGRLAQGPDEKQGLSGRMAGRDEAEGERAFITLAEKRKGQVWCERGDSNP